VVIIVLENIMGYRQSSGDKYPSWTSIYPGKWASLSWWTIYAV